MLELTGLTTSYGEFELGPLDLSVENEVLAVLGPSGSGKTTLLSSIAGIVSPDAGSISLDGNPLVGRPIERRHTGIVFQDGALFPHLTAGENIEYAATDRDRIEELTTLLEITDLLNRRPPTLSGGEKQRVALARTLATDPDVLLLDEPLSSLDAPIRRRLRGELHRLFESLDIPVLYVTHDQRTATALGDRIAILRAGTVEQVGSPSDVIDRPRTRFVARFTGNDNLFDAAVTERTNGVVSLRIGDCTLQTDGEYAGGSTVTACVHPSRIELYRRDENGRSRDGNTFSGTVRRWLNEGNGYRADVAIDGIPGTLSATIQPSVFDRLSVERGSAVRVVIPRTAIHLIT